MNSKLNVLMAQFNPTVGAIEANTDKIIQIIQDHQSRHDIIVFPELAICGYPPEDLLLRPAFFSRIRQGLKKIREATGPCHVVIGHPVLEGETRFNSASVFYEKKLLHLYHKQILPQYGVFDEARYFTRGPASPCLFEVNGYRLALCICEDLWSSQPVELALEAGADTLLCLNASPFDYSKYYLRENLLRAHAMRGLSIIYVNLTGGQDELLFDGQSLAMDKQGRICGRAAAFDEEMLSIHFEGDTLSGSMASSLETTALIYKALVSGVKDYVEKNHFPGIVLGLSGGVDSALTLAIAVDALGASRVHALMMPSRYSADISLKDAEKQAGTLKINSSVLSIEPAFTALLDTLAPSFKNFPKDITEENIQSRIRGILLMAFSNKTGNLVLTTSNKSETAVGYATLYGDMAGGFAVLKDVLKTQVYQLAQYRNSLSKVIPERVITRAPSAELAEDQTDQDSLPPYPLLDDIITFHMEDNMDAEEIIRQGMEPEMVKKVLQMIKRNEYKRRQAPPGIKISPRAFGRDWRFPITSGF